METKPYSLQAPEAIAKEYGGNKRAIAQAAQQGLVDPTAAVLAGMFIDRMRQAQALEQAPTQTVAQDVMAPQQPQMGMPPQQPQMGMPGQAPKGLTALPLDDQMFNDASFAGGGIVAFQTGGSAYMGMPVGESPFTETSFTTPEEIMAYKPRFFPGMGAGNRRFKLMQLGYTRDQIEKMPVEQQEFIVQRAGAVTTTPPEVAAEQAKAAPGPQVSAGQAPPVVPPAAQPQIAAPTLPAQAAPSLSGLLAERQALLPEGEAYAGLEKEIQESKAKREESKKESMWLRVAEMGFGMAASQSPYLAQAIGQAGTQALKGYADDLKEQKKLDREDRKLLADIEQARRAEKRGDVDKASEMYTKAMSEMRADDRARLQAETSLKVAQIGAGAPGAEEKLIERYAKAKGISFDEAVREIAAAKAEGKDPMLSYLTGQLSAGRNQVNIRDLLQKYPGIQATR